jgi:exonuclease VII small subunit
MKQEDIQNEAESQRAMDWVRERDNALEASRKLDAANANYRRARTDITILKTELAEARQRIQTLEYDATNQVCHQISIDTSLPNTNAKVVWIKARSALLNDASLFRIRDVVGRVAPKNDLVIVTGTDL